MREKSEFYLFLSHARSEEEVPCQNCVTASRHGRGAHCQHTHMHPALSLRDPCAQKELSILTSPKRKRRNRRAILLRTRRSGAGCSRADRAVRVATHSAMVYVCLLYAGKFLQKQQPYAAMTSESRPLESPASTRAPKILSTGWPRPVAQYRCCTAQTRGGAWWLATRRPSAP